MIIIIIAMSVLYAIHCIKMPVNGYVAWCEEYICITSLSVVSKMALYAKQYTLWYTLFDMHQEKMACLVVPTSYFEFI